MKALSKTLSGVALALATLGAAHADILTYIDPWVPGNFFGGPTNNGQIFYINNIGAQYTSDTTMDPATPQMGDSFDDLFVFNSVPSFNSTFQLIMSSLGGANFTGLNILDASAADGNPTPEWFDTDTFATPQTSFDFDTMLAGGEYALELTGTFLQDSGTYSGYIGENIPEPATLALVGLGLSMALSARRKAKRK